MTFGERVKEAADEWVREDSGRSVKLLCNLAGISEPTYYNWLKGETTPDVTPKFLKFCNLVKRYPAYLLWGKGPKTLGDSTAAGKLLDTISDFSDEEYKALLAQAELLKRARPSQK